MRKAWPRSRKPSPSSGELAADKRATYQPDLAYSLHTLSTALAEAGRREESVAPIQEAVTIYREVAAGKPRRLKLNGLDLRQANVTLWSRFRDSRSVSWDLNPLVR